MVRLSDRKDLPSRLRQLLLKAAALLMFVSVCHCYTGKAGKKREEEQE